ncbi:putative photosynthetic complex assembly protein [Blastochloris viridis]|uniref:Putative photosynthetic complex assembly protein n=1 Tax=Blastochloris viridis TaxID=1079 RepID=A0A0S4Q0Q9_BLAVI|nr:putative photosynthetic complex assembly protein [Blastochloris viridis]
MAVVAVLVFGPHLRGDIGVPPDAQPRTVVETRDLRFETNDEGHIAVFDAVSTDRIYLLEGDKWGFLRGMVRAFAHERKVAGDGSDKPYRLSLFSDGRLTLTDLSTGRDFVLNAFGPTNIAQFTRFLKSQEGKAGEATQ